MVGGQGGRGGGIGVRVMGVGVVRCGEGQVVGLVGSGEYRWWGSGVVGGGGG